MASNRSLRSTGPNKGFLPHLPESLETLDLLLLHVARPRKVHQDGIRFQGFRYIDPVLAAYVGESVTIHYDPRDMAEIRIFYENYFLCRALCQEITTEKISLKDIQKARRERKKTLKETIKKRISLVDHLLINERKNQFVSNEIVQKEETKRAVQPKIRLYEND